MPEYHARVAFNGHEGSTGRLVVNVVHVEVAVLTSPPNWNSVATDIYAWLGNLWANILPTFYTFDELVVTDENYPGSTFGQGIHVVGTPGTRTLSDTKLDPAMCAVASWKTAVAKRYARGHTFFAPCLTSTDTATSGLFTVAGGYMTACKAFADAYTAGHVVGSTDYAPAIFSKHEEALGHTPYWFPIAGYSLSPKQHWLRSRSTAP